MDSIFRAPRDPSMFPLVISQAPRKRSMVSLLCEILRGWFPERDRLACNRTSLCVLDCVYWVGFAWICYNTLRWYNLFHGLCSLWKSKITRWSENRGFCSTVLGSTDTFGLKDAHDAAMQEAGLQKLQNFCWPILDEPKALKRCSCLEIVSLNTTNWLTHWK